MPEEQALPFHSFAFTLVQDRQPRASLRMIAGEDDMYELQVQKGSAANPSTRFTRVVPVETAERLRDTLQAVGAFGWNESYGDTQAPGTRKWSMGVVFKEGVFSLETRGGSDVPAGFDDLLEELYRLDFPRPGAGGSRTGASGMRGMSAGDLGAYASMGSLGASGIDFSQMADLMRGNSLPGLDASEMQDLLAQAQSNPSMFQQRMKDEFRHMPPDEQNRMLDALAATGLASRAWWERFLRG